MAKAPRTATEIAAILKEVDEGGRPVATVLRHHGISRRTYRKWKAAQGAAEAMTLVRLNEPTPKPWRAIMRELFWPPEFVAKMARIVAALSTFALIHDSFAFGLSYTFGLLLEHYDTAVSLAVSWAAPYVIAIAQYIAAHIHITIVVDDTWRHVFVVLWILLLRDAGVALADGRRGLAAFRAALGIGIATLSSVIASAGLGASSQLVRNAQLAIVPYIGIYIYDLVLYGFSAVALKRQWANSSQGMAQSRWSHFRAGAVRASKRFGLILGAIGVCFLFPEVSTMPFPKGGLFTLGIATLVNLSYWVVRGIGFAAHLRRSSEVKRAESWKVLFSESEAGRFALAVGGVFAWIITFTLLNTASAILGL